MARKCKPRYLYKEPDYTYFSASEKSSEEVELTLDEYECIRLIDEENLSQDECARSMGVARTTVQAMYDHARKVIAKLIIKGYNLKISGGNCVFLDQSSYESNKENKQMKVAVTYENGMVFQHFGHTETMQIFTVEDDKILNVELVSTEGSGHAAIATFLKDHDVDAVICGGIGGGAIQALNDLGIKLYQGVNGKTEDAVNSLLKGQLISIGFAGNELEHEGHCCHHHDGDDHECCHHDGDDHECCHHDDDDHECCHHHEGGHCHHSK